MKLLIDTEALLAIHTSINLLVTIPNEYFKYQWKQQSLRYVSISDSDSGWAARQLSWGLSSAGDLAATYTILHNAYRLGRGVEYLLQALDSLQDVAATNFSESGWPAEQSMLPSFDA